MGLEGSASEFKDIHKLFLNRRKNNFTLCGSEGVNEEDNYSLKII